MADEPAEEKVSKGAWAAMGATVCALLLVVVYANVQHLRRAKIESVTITRYTPSPSPSPSPSAR